jgi:hypothetical protein
MRREAFAHFGRRLAVLALLGDLSVTLAHAGPLSNEQERSAPPSAISAQALSAAELVLTDPGLESAPEFSANDISGTPRERRARAGLQGTGRDPGTDMFYGLDAEGAISTATFRDALRGLVNVQPGGPPRKGTPQRRGNVPPDNFGLDLGAEAREWIQGTVNDIVDSMLRPEFNARGRVSFSILGVGDFSVDASADRQQIAFSAGDEVLLTAHRQSLTADPGYGGPQGAIGGPVAHYPASVSSAGPSGSGHLLHEILEVVSDAASHPIALLVYAVLLAYGLLWAVLSRRNSRPMPVRNHSRPIAYAEPMANLQRSRVRGERRARRHKRRTSRRLTR